MKDKSLVRLLIVILLCVGISIAHMPVAQGDIVFKQIQGLVNDAPGPVRAWDASQNGEVYYYIQNRTNEGSGTDPMETMGPGQDYYDPAISEGITDWIPGDDCILVVNRDFGTYGVDHAGYLAYDSVILNTDGVQVNTAIDLLKIPTPTIGTIGSGFINVDWTPLADPKGIIAGYTVYSSPDNGSTSGDLEWTLVGGTVAAPLTGSTFNDTGVNPGDDYYYALKVVFTGYTLDTPGNVDNYECTVFGEGSAMVTAPVSLFSVDYILIEYLNTTEVTTINLDVGQSTVTVYAQGWNNTGPTKVGAVKADWTVDLPALGSCNPAVQSVSSVFTANFQGGTAIVTATNGSMTDTFTVIIAPPVIDYIVLEDGMGAEILDQVWNMSLGSLEVWAAGYNNTGPTFIAYQDVTWENFTVDTGTGKFNVTTGPTVMYTGMSPGGVEVRGTLSPGVFDNFTLNLVWGIPPTVNYIMITDNLGNEITSEALDIMQQTELYAWGFNASSGAPVGPVSVDWSFDAGGTIDVTAGYSTNLTAGIAGLDITLTATYGLMTDDLVVTVNAPTVDYINVTDAGDGNDLVTVEMDTEGMVMAYASGYNNTGNTYVGLVIVTWSADPTGLGDFDLTSTDVVTYTGSNSGPGMVVITATYAPGIEDNFTVDLKEFTLDYIEITDGPNGPFIDDVDLDVGATITLTASGYNTTGGFVGVVSVDWTQNPSIGTFSVATGDTTVFTAGIVEGSTSITGENTAEGVSDNFLLDINTPTVDYIEIRNATDGGGDAITTGEFTLGDVITQNYYCAGYNTTSGYVEDVNADWTLDPATGIGTVVAAGTFTLFTATGAGTVELMADVSGMTDSIDITVNAEDDTTPPATPTGLTAAAGTAAKTIALSWNANTDDAIGYNIYRSTTETGTYTMINSALITTTSYTDTDATLDYATEYFYKITAEDASENESPQSAFQSGTTAAAPPEDDDDEDDDGFPIILLLIPLIIIIVLILLFLMMKKKKPEEAPPEKEEKELPPPPGAKAEAEEEVEEVEEEEEMPPPEDEGEEAPEEEGDEEKPPEE
jgi:hypothetical protein